MSWQNQDQLRDAAYGGAAAIVALVMRAPVNIRVSMATLVAGITASFVFARPIARWIHADPDWRVPLSCFIGYMAYFAMKALVTIGVELSEKPMRFLARFRFLEPFIRKD